MILREIVIFMLITAGLSVQSKDLFKLSDSITEILRTLTGESVGKTQAKVIAYYPVDKVIIQSEGFINEEEEVVCKWMQTAGPYQLNITNQDSLTCVVNKPLPGKYNLKLKVIDKFGRETFNETVLVVNRKPSCKTARDTITTFEGESVRLIGKGEDADNDSLTYSWEKIAGPPAFVSDSSRKSLLIKDLKEGLYKFRLKVSDSYYLFCSDDVILKVGERN